MGVCELMHNHKNWLQYFIDHWKLVLSYFPLSTLPSLTQASVCNAPGVQTGLTLEPDASVPKLQYEMSVIKSLKTTSHTERLIWSMIQKAVWLSSLVLILLSFTLSLRRGNLKVSWIMLQYPSCCQIHNWPKMALCLTVETNMFVLRHHQHCACAHPQTAHSDN